MGRGATARCLNLVHRSVAEVCEGGLIHLIISVAERPHFNELCLSAVADVTVSDVLSSLAGSLRTL